VTLGLHGDVKATLLALIPKLNQKSNRDFLVLAQQRMKDWNNLTAKIESNQAVPVKPQYLVAQVSKLMKDDAVVAIDTGAHTVFTARHWKIKPDQQLVVCGNLASMAPGLPYALAAQVAYPRRQCIAMVGDGSFTMLMGEMATAVLYHLPVKVILFKNNALAMDRFEQEDLGNPDYGIALQPIDFAKIAEACGAEGYTCKRPEEIEPTLRKAFASSRPALIQVEVDPDENPLPPEKINA
jgi:pyruvate dehydrogenase (quinone)